MYRPSRRIACVGVIALVVSVAGFVALAVYDKTVTHHGTSWVEATLWLVDVAVLFAAIAVSLAAVRPRPPDP
jgi:hypothetical protein